MNNTETSEPQAPGQFAEARGSTTEHRLICQVCLDPDCTGFRHMMQSDPHYERLRDPRNKRIELLEETLRCVMRQTGDGSGNTNHIETLRAAKENMRAAWLAARYALESPNAGTQRPGTPDGLLATETRKPGSLK